MVTALLNGYSSLFQSSYLKFRVFQNSRNNVFECTPIMADDLPSFGINKSNNLKCSSCWKCWFHIVPLPHSFIRIIYSSEKYIQNFLLLSIYVCNRDLCYISVFLLLFGYFLGSISFTCFFVDFYFSSNIMCLH